MTEPIRLRADAQRNREKILETATVAFAEHGLDASLDDIARQAGVGSGTLYRHFPTRDDLITAVFIDRVAEIVSRLQLAQSSDDPWDGFAEWTRTTCQALAGDRGLADVVAFGPRKDLGSLNSRAYKGMTELVQRAASSGQLRADFHVEDLVLLMVAVAGITHRAGPIAPAAIDRFVALALDGYRTQAASPAPPPVQIFPHFGTYPEHRNSTTTKATLRPARRPGVV